MLSGDIAKCDFSDKYFKLDLFEHVSTTQTIKNIWSPHKNVGGKGLY